jgi:hypothetical protein
MEDNSEINQQTKEPSITSYDGSVEFELDDWREVLGENKNLKEFKGNKSRASYVLETFGRGISETFQEFNKRGIECKPPDIGINFKNNGPAISYDIDNDLVVVSLEFLESLSDKKFDLSSKYNFRRGDDEVVYRGKLSEWVLSMADEEAHHSLYTKVKGRRSEFINALDISLSEYDAMPVERRAQRWVLQSAKRRNFSSEAIDYLEKRYKNAGEFIQDKK